jgi:hypothetical protein
MDRRWLVSAETNSAFIIAIFQTRDFSSRFVASDMCFVTFHTLMRGYCVLLTGLKLVVMKPVGLGQIQSGHKFLKITSLGR